MNGIVIELFGIPGCGKTTISKELQKIYFEHDIKMLDFSEEFSKYESLGLWRIRLILSSNFKDLYRYSKLYYSLYRTIPSRSVNDFKYSLFMFLNLLFLRKLTKKNETIICDEGQMQYLFSIYYNRSIQNILPVANLVHAIQYDFPSISFFCVQADDKTIIKRLNERPSKHSRLNYENMEKLMSTILTQKHNMEMIGSLIEYQKASTISSLKEPGEAAMDIISVVKRQEVLLND